MRLVRDVELIYCKVCKSVFSNAIHFHLEKFFYFIYLILNVKKIKLENKYT